MEFGLKITEMNQGYYAGKVTIYWDSVRLSNWKLQISPNYGKNRLLEHEYSIFIMIQRNQSFQFPIQNLCTNSDRNANLYMGLPLCTPSALTRLDGGGALRNLRRHLFTRACPAWPPLCWPNSQTASFLASLCSWRKCDCRNTQEQWQALQKLSESYIYNYIVIKNISTFLLLPGTSMNHSPGHYLLMIYTLVQFDGPGSHQSHF